MDLLDYCKKYYLISTFAKIFIHEKNTYFSFIVIKFYKN